MFRIPYTFPLSLLLLVPLATPAAAGDCPAVQVTCPALPNSVGPGAQLDWVGDCGLYEGTLVATGMPANARCWFIYGYPTLPMPYGSGTICNQPGWIAFRTFSDSSGAALMVLGDDIELDDERWINSPLFPQTAVFQVLYRDVNAAGPPYNLTNGLLTLLK